MARVRHIHVFLASQVNMLAREYCDAAGIKLKPVILSHHMLYGLKQVRPDPSPSRKKALLFLPNSSPALSYSLACSSTPPS